MERQTRTDKMETQRTFTTSLRRDAGLPVSRDDEKTPFENFEGLAAKLLKVPKEEVDEKRAEREKKRTE